MNRQEHAEEAKRLQDLADRGWIMKLLYQPSADYHRKKAEEVSE